MSRFGVGVGILRRRAIRSGGGGGLRAFLVLHLRAGPLDGDVWLRLGAGGGKARGRTAALGVDVLLDAIGRVLRARRELVVPLLDGGTAPDGADAGEGAGMWEFQVLRIAPHCTAEQATALLQEQAQRGWDIVAVVPSPSGQVAVGHWVYLRRPRPARTVRPPAREEAGA
jgi:hypothetical protein